MTNPTSLTGLEKALGVNFHSKELLAQALTHRSAAKQSRSNGHNERLEFLGDAVLELVVTEYLYQVSDKPEGELTNWRSALVQGDHLAKIAKEMKLGKYLFMSRGEEASGGRDKTSTLANALEALIGAVYLDRGFDVTRDVIQRVILVRLGDLILQGKHHDEKSLFQEIAQEKTGKTPTYQTIEEEGPDHEKLFTCAVFIGDEQIATGKGLSKQRAEQEAAGAALNAKGWHLKRL